MNEIIGLGLLLGFMVFIAEGIILPYQAWHSTLNPTLQFLVSSGIFTVGASIVIFGGFYFLVGRFNHRVKRKTLKELQRMNPFEFEQYVSRVLQANGYRRVKVSSKTNDGGKDIVCYDRFGRKCVVEVKRYADHNLIGRPLIQKLHSCMIHERATRAIFVTTSDFNQNAVQYAKGKNIDLINGKQFVNMIKS